MKLTETEVDKLPEKEFKGPIITIIKTSGEKNA